VPMSVLEQNEASVRLATLESMVLLKNQQNVLPSEPGLNIAVIGPHAKAQSALVGNYLGQICPDDTINCVQTPLDAITALNVGGSTIYSAGCPLTKNDESQIPAAVASASDADLVVMFLGIDESVEAEGRDRQQVDLPGSQHALAAAVLATGKPVVIVLINGGMVAVAEEAAAEGAVAILEAFYPGMFGAEAIAMTIFGQNDHLGGKLPITVYNASYVEDIKMSEMELNVGIGRTYKYYKGTPIFPFGHGLSFTNFSAESAGVSGKIATDGSSKASIEVNLTNIGSRPGDDVIQVYIVPTDDTLMPGLKKRLVDYKRVHLLPGASQEVTFSISRDSTRVIRSNGDIVATAGVYRVIVSNGNMEAPEIISTVEVLGEEAVLDAFPSVPQTMASKLFI